MKIDGTIIIFKTYSFIKTCIDEVDFCHILISVKFVTT